MKFCLTRRAFRVAAIGALFSSTVFAQNVDRISTEEVARRQAAMPRGVAAVARGQAAMQARNYRLAHDEFRNALNLLPDAVTSEKAHEEALTGFCDSGIRVAEQAVADGNYAEAESILREVVQDRYDPNCRAALEMLAHLQQPGYFNKTSGPKFIEKVEQVKQLFAEAQGYYDTGRFDLAFKKYEQILAIDPYNTAARQGEEKIDNAKYNHAEQAYNESRARAVWQVEKGWENPNSTNSNRPAQGSTFVERETSDTAAITNKLRTIVIPRLEYKDATLSEVIDDVRQKAIDSDESGPSGKGVNIVLRTRPLGQIAPRTPLVDSLPPGAVAAPAAPGLESSPPPGVVPARPLIPSQPNAPEQAAINLVVTNIQLGEALRYIANEAGLKLKVETQAVLLIPISEQTDQLITKRYRVPPEFFGGPLDVGMFLQTDIGGESRQQQADQGGKLESYPVATNSLKETALKYQSTTHDPGGSTTDKGETTASTRQQLKNDRQLVGRADAKTYLQSMGVAFPSFPHGCIPGDKEKPCADQASASFFPHSGVLIVRNTADNLDIIDALVEQANASGVKQVEIEAKFIEINQNNLKELGFDWLLGQFNVGNHKVFAGGGTSGTGNPVNPADWPFVPPGSQTPVGQFPITAGNRSGQLALTANSIDALLFPSMGTSALAPAIFGLSGVFTDPQFQVVIRALNQKKGIDLLSAPKITTKSGQRAIIEIVREFRYPTTFTEPKVPDIQGRGSSNSTSTTIALPVVGPSTPGGFETRNTGVTLEVEPVVGPDGVTIDLNLIPQVVEFEGFINYGSPIKTVNPALLGFSPSTLLGTTNEAITLTDNVINQPIFSTRKVTTSVQVMNGQTVVLGGLIREDVQKVEDRTPFIGDLPLVGRLFRTNVDQHIKRNLIIFVTARKVTSYGEIAAEEEDTAEPVLQEIPAYKK